MSRVSLFKKKKHKIEKDKQGKNLGESLDTEGVKKSENLTLEDFWREQLKLGGILYKENEIHSSVTEGPSKNKSKRHSKPGKVFWFNLTHSLILYGVIAALGLILYTNYTASEIEVNNEGLTGIREYKLLEKVADSELERTGNESIKTVIDIDMSDNLFIDEKPEETDSDDGGNEAWTDKQIYYFHDKIVASYGFSEQVITNSAGFTGSDGLDIIVTDVSNISNINNTVHVDDDSVEISTLRNELTEDINSILMGEEPLHGAVSLKAKQSINKSVGSSVKYIEFGRDNLDRSSYNIVLIQIVKEDGAVVSLIGQLNKKSEVYNLISL